MYRMNNLVEILLGLILIFLVVGQPKILGRYTDATLGKILFLAATIAAGYHSMYAGVLVVIIYIIIHKNFMIVENMENNNIHHTDTDFVKKHCKDGKLDDSTKPPALKFKKQKCNPCDDTCEFEVTSGKEQITVDEALRPKESNSIPV